VHAAGRDVSSLLRAVGADTVDMRIAHDPGEYTPVWKYPSGPNVKT